jgi:hypothetical protein
LSEGGVRVRELNDGGVVGFVAAGDVCDRWDQGKGRAVVGDGWESRGRRVAI